MKWIFALLFLIPSLSFAAESTPAYQPEVYIGKVGGFNNPTYLAGSYTVSDAISSLVSQCHGSGYKNCSSDGNLISVAPPLYRINIVFFHSSNLSKPLSRHIDYSVTSSTSGPYSCPPPGKPDFTIGPVDLNGSKVCQKKPKICLKGAILRVTSDGKETCVPNCSSAAGLAHTGPYYFKLGPNVGSTAGQVKCYGQCSIQTIGGDIEISGVWRGSFTFTGANCPVVRPEPSMDSESDTSSSGDSTPVDNSNTSEGTDNAMNELDGAASGATSTTVKPDASGPNGETTLKDVAKVVADSANAQIKATSEQNVATGKLVSNISKDIQNAIHNSGHGGGGASASLQAQGNGKLDGIKQSLDQISDKLDKEDEGDGPFVPGSGSGKFWESVIPESSFTEIKDKKAQSIQKIKDLNTEFQSTLQFTELSAQGAPEEWQLNLNGTVLPFGMGAFQMMLDAGIASVILLICALYAIYIITNRK
ncbi:hypothetical protein [Aeromonas sobria]|uniref:hypothetical protein n=1 Tax=Aeromonas sobria TaxID=646 RepID=UPI0012FEA0A1|nr:hypothetical protein [Aeromonas sobria]